MRWLLLAALCGGCISTRAAIGPTVTTEGDVGVEATVGVAFGVNKARSHVVFIGVDGGGTYWPGDAKLGGVAIDSIDVENVIDASGEPIIRAGGRFGLRNTPTDHAGAIGGGVAILPFSRRQSSGGGSSHEKGGLDLGFVSWAQWGIGVDASFLWLFSDETSLGVARVAAIIEWTSLAR